MCERACACVLRKENVFLIKWGRQEGVKIELTRVSPEQKVREQWQPVCQHGGREKPTCMAMGQMSSGSYISLGKQTFGCLRDAFCALFCLAYFKILRKSRGSLSHILPGPRLCRDQAWSYGVRQINNNSSISAAELGELHDFSDTPQETKDTSRNKTCWILFSDLAPLTTSPRLCLLYNSAHMFFE